MLARRIRMGVGGFDLTQDLIAYWKMDETSWSGSAGEVVDSVGSANGTAVNGATTTTSPSKFGSAGAFIGASSQYVDLGSPGSLSLTELTVAAWVYLNTSTSAQIITAGFPWRVQTNTSSHAILVDNASNVLESVSSISTGVWTHLVWTASASGLGIYINGVLNNSNTTAFIGGTAGSSYIGKQSGQYCDGYIDDLRVYNKAKSPAWVSYLFNYIP